MLRFALLTGLGVVATLGCAENLEQMVRTRAATDFSCPAEDIQLTETYTSVLVRQYTASGCEQSDFYSAECGQFFQCKTFNSADAAAEEAQYQEELQRQFSGPSSSPPPPANSSSGDSSNEEQPDNASPGCHFNSDCGGGGAICNSGKCSNAHDGTCHFDSECPGGKCNSGKCRF